MSKIKAGDKVKLKSGGPVMTVDSLHKNRQGETDGAFCKWFEGSKLDTSLFMLESLELMPDDETPDWKVAPAIGS